MILLLICFVLTSSFCIIKFGDITISTNPTEKIKKYLGDLTGGSRFSRNIPQLEIDSDKDKDGLKDLADIVEGARKDAANKPTYRSAYYTDGYPPANEGVCTDVIWRAFMNAGYNLKEMVDLDIKKNPQAYPRVGNKPDPNIDFRRVPNLVSFFSRHAAVLTTEIIPNNLENLKEWQAGDIIVFDKPAEHIAIISDIRRADGVPFIIHNSSPYTTEADVLLYWAENYSKISGHYRWPKIVN